MQARNVFPVIAMVSLGLVLGSCSAGPNPARDNASVVEPEDAGDGGALAAGTADRVARAGVWWRNPEIVTALGLSEEQLERIQAVKTADADQRSTERKRERHAIMAYLRALSQDPYDPVLVERRSAELTEIVTTIQRHRIDDVYALRDILTYAQWMQLWDVAPQALQLGRFKVTLGPTVTITDGTAVTDDGETIEDRVGDAVQAP